MPLSPGFAVVAFGSVGQVGKSVLDLDMNDLKGAGGIGFRVALNREQRLNLRLDIAFSPSRIAPYVNMSEAFWPGPRISVQNQPHRTLHELSLIHI